MRRHVIGPFQGVVVQAIAFRYQAGKEFFQIGLHVRVGIFLDHQTCGSVSDEQRQQTILYAGLFQPMCDDGGKGMQTIAPDLNTDVVK